MNLDDLLKEIYAPCRCREAREALEALKTKMRCCPEFNLVAYPKEGRELVAFHAEVTGVDCRACRNTGRQLTQRGREVLAMLRASLADLGDTPIPF